MLNLCQVLLVLLVSVQHFGSIWCYRNEFYKDLLAELVNEYKDNEDEIDRSNDYHDLTKFGFGHMDRDPYEKNDYFGNQIRSSVQQALEKERGLIEDTTNLDPVKEDSRQKVIDLVMPSVRPSKDDDYLCVGVKLPTSDTYLIKYEPEAEMQIAHHMLLFGCGEPFRKNQMWKCGEMQPVCASGGQQIMYAWAKNAPVLEMAKDVGFHVGGDTGINYAVLQVHYASAAPFRKDKKLKDKSGLKITYTKEDRQYYAGMYLLADGWTDIPPHKEKSHIDMGCKYPIGQPPIFPFRFRTHAHALGLVITGYRIRYNKETEEFDWTLIGRGDPQRPQAFYKVFNDVDIRGGDYIVGRCTYNSTSRDHVTHIGATHLDEMCNFYIMFFYDHHKYSYPDNLCVPLNMEKDAFYTQWPKDSDTPLIEMEKRNRIEAKKKVTPFSLVHGWPQDGLTDGELPLTVGQIAGVDIDPISQNVVIFQRGGNLWDFDTFDSHNVLQKKNKITVNTLVWLNQSTGDIIKVDGANSFYLPHGISFDHEGNIWLTDVGTHQVYKFSPEMKLQLTLGEKFVPGHDYEHFCKPTDVQIMKSGDFFVSDGYCNERVLKFNIAGQVIGEISGKSFKEKEGFPAPYDFKVVHGLSLDEDGNRLFVADRENARVLVFKPSTLEFIKAIDLKQYGSVYAVAFCPGNGGELQIAASKMVKSIGVTYDLSSDTVTNTWKPDNQLAFGLPHDIAVNKECTAVYLPEIRPPFRIWKLVRQ